MDRLVLLYSAAPLPSKNINGSLHSSSLKASQARENLEMHRPCTSQGFISCPRINDSIRTSTPNPHPSLQTGHHISILRIADAAAGLNYLQVQAHQQGWLSETLQQRGAGLCVVLQHMEGEHCSFPLAMVAYISWTWAGWNCLWRNKLAKVEKMLLLVNWSSSREPPPAWKCTTSVKHCCFNDGLHLQHYK